jgi:hypothetical protein
VGGGGGLGKVSRSTVLWVEEVGKKVSTRAAPDGGASI